MPPIKPFEAGTKQVSASQLNTLVDALKSAVGMRVDGGEISRDGGVPQLRIPTGMRFHLGKLTGEVEEGLYSWIELEPNETGDLAEKIGGMRGELVEELPLNCIREVGNTAGIPINTIVLVFEIPNAASASLVEGEVDDNWRFIASNGGMIELDVVVDVCPTNPVLADGSVTTEQLADGAALRPGDTFIGA
ncbi:hypothetical protein [Tuwongella immobilis]|uniref:Uncharacterized protein n=1 Tax=Tuwongella immobilis TaxID=692036 RepID=A0A6C2YP37_9BACT|nr:hypothetical protein [Tuwongella immobilis]VIP03061.1 unnamed protein product [Tuwongella immobilis]VTS03270.1 unnamed protein product [Tuwongella immobilis]